MIEFNRFVLSNGLRVIVHEDPSTPIAVMNVLYDVGARDEDPSRTGFAHLFEHLMFGGSKHIPDFDEPLQRAGGENNAYTTNDLTNYYLQLPAENLETAFWLESDRMLSLAFSKESLEVQRKVVSEEFKEHYLNKPYGDAWMHLRELAYHAHPYRWLTIGKELRHIEEANLDEVRAFFFAHYRPVNAILVVAGNVRTADVERLAKKWFGPIEPGTPTLRRLPQEPTQQAARVEKLNRKVPLDALYKAWHIPGRLDPRYYAVDLLTDILGGGASSRLFQSLAKEKKIFSNIDCYHYGSLDPGLLAIEGKLVKGVSMDQAEAAVDNELDRLIREGLDSRELDKAKHKAESMMAFEDMGLANRAASLAFYELLGDAGMMNSELEKYQAVDGASVMDEARSIFKPSNSNTLYYCAHAE